MLLIDFSLFCAIHSLKLFFFYCVFFCIFFCFVLCSEGFSRAGGEAEDVFGKHSAAPAVRGGGVLVSAPLQTEPVLGGKRPQRPIRAFCSH